MVIRSDNPFQNKTVAEIVSDDYKAAEVFNRHQIDFCCNGNISLEDLCARRKIEYEKIIAELKIALHRQNKVVPDFSKWSVESLISHILEEHHGFIRRSTPMLLEFTAKVAKVHGHANPEVVKVAELFRDLSDELEPHMMKEERILFPYILQLSNATEKPAAPFGTVENPIHMMHVEHELAGNLMKQIISDSKDFYLPPHACNTWRAAYGKLKEYSDDLFLHVHLENNILFPKAIELENRWKNK